MNFKINFFIFRIKRYLYHITHYANPKLRRFPFSSEQEKNAVLKEDKDWYRETSYHIKPLCTSNGVNYFRLDTRDDEVGFPQIFFYKNGVLVKIGGFESLDLLNKFFDKGLLKEY